MKKRKYNFFEWVGVVFVFLLISLMLAIFVKPSITDNPVMKILSFMFFLVFTIIILIGSIYIFVKSTQKSKSWKKALQKAKKELNPEYQPVLLKDARIIPVEMAKCQAKLDSDGKIVCKIHFDSDIEITLDSYEGFYFRFSLEDE